MLMILYSLEHNSFQSRLCIWPTRLEKKQQHGEPVSFVSVIPCLFSDLSPLTDAVWRDKQYIRCLWVFFLLQTKQTEQHGQPRPERRCGAGQFKGTQRPAVMNTSVTKMEKIETTNEAAVEPVSSVPAAPSGTVEIVHSRKCSKEWTQQHIPSWIIRIDVSSGMIFFFFFPRHEAVMLRV